MHSQKLNPFLYGRPVPPAKFIGRRALLRTVFSRIHHGDSTALLGLPHFGKSSVLCYIDSLEVRQAWLGSAAAALQIIQIDCHAFSASARPRDLWHSIVESIAAYWQADEGVRQAAGAAHAAGYGAMAMTKLFGQALGDRGRRIALLLDEVEVLLHHPNFCTAEFLGMLRSLSTRTDGMVLLIASHVSLTQMNRLSAEINYGSPFFNNCIELPLLPLSVAEIELLIGSSLISSPSVFDQADNAFIIEQSGGQPYLVQAAAAALFDATVEGVARSPIRYKHAAAALHEQVRSYFDTLWQHLDSHHRLALLKLVLSMKTPAVAPAPGSVLNPIERMQLRQLGLLVSGSIGETQTASGAGDQMAESMGTWLLGQACAVAGGLALLSWEQWLGDVSDCKEESERLYTCVRQAAGSHQLSMPVVWRGQRAVSATKSTRTPPAPTRSSLRQVLSRLLRSSSELDRFCLDYFKRPVFDRFTSGMDRTTRVNLLLESIEPTQILMQLASAFPQDLEDCRHLLQYPTGSDPLACLPT